MKVDMVADMMVDMVADITFDTFVLLWSAWLARNISVLPSALAPLGKDTGHCIVCPAVFHCGQIYKYKNTIYKHMQIRKYTNAPLGTMCVPCCLPLR